jgi:nitrogen-specific signal transduction histidine kinase/ActR/RegA family two-component response regulator
MSEHKRLEAELSQARKMEAIGTLAGGISHDFSNILQTISGFTELLLTSKDKNDPDYKKLIHIATQASRANELTSRLSTFSRKVESHIRPLNLNREIENLKDILTRAIPRMIDIEFHLSDKLEMIDADPTQIEQVIMNLALNARDAMPDSGKLVIRTEKVILNKGCPDCPKAVPGRYILITVSDTGAGMDRKVLEYIFDPFYTTKEVGKGTGLGLSVVHGIVGSHKGYINCVSVPGRGTAFKIYLPVSEAEMENQGKGEGREKEIAGGEESILLVDDEQGILEWGREFLKNYGYRVATAENGEKAITKMRESISQSGNGFDLVILDLNMPGMGGYKCFQELVKIKPEIKVIIASGYSANEQMIKKSPELGNRAFIKKPYQMSDMLNKMRDVLKT